MNDTTSSQLAAALTGFGLIFGIIAIASIILAIVIWWRIFSKAGYSGALSLLMFVPIANLVMLLILAFQLRMMRSQQYPPNPQYPQAQQYPQAPQYPQSPPNPQYRG